jgi:hypothetical protein
MTAWVFFPAFGRRPIGRHLDGSASTKRPLEVLPEKHPERLSYDADGLVIVQPGQVWKMRCMNTHVVIVDADASKVRYRYHGVPRSVVNVILMAPFRNIFTSRDLEPEARPLLPVKVRECLEKVSLDLKE